LKLQRNSAYLLGVADLSGDWLFRSERKDTENSTAEEGGYPAFAGSVILIISLLLISSDFP
jgi:hypothetical protein